MSHSAYITKVVHVSVKALYYLLKSASQLSDRKVDFGSCVAFTYYSAKYSDKLFLQVAIKIVQ